MRQLFVPLRSLAVPLIFVCLVLGTTRVVSGFSLNLNHTLGAWESFQKLAGCHKGENISGISSLKQYFHRFGYIPDSPSNFSDSFDEALEWALQTYQKNFNLNSSGILDASTLSQIVRPRCGNPDIVNGTTTMNAGKHNHSTGGIHSVAHFSFFPGRPTWPANKRELTYVILPTSDQPSDAQVLSTVFARAFSRWSEVIPRTFKETTSTASADIQIAFFTGDHGDGEEFDGNLGTLAHAFSPPDGRFHLDGAENWNVDSSSLGLTEVDLESVAVHEIGHLLGLGHSSESDAIMYPTISSGKRKVQLANDDIDGIQQLYGTNPSYNGTSSDSSTSTVPTTRERDTSDGHVSWESKWGRAALVALPLGAVLLTL